MNLTISVLEGLLLLLPGLTALGAWNFLGSRAAARRPELPLTAVNSLAVAMLVALVVHTAGIGMAQVVVSAASEWNALGFAPRLPELTNPYAGAVRLLAEHPVQPDPAGSFGLLVVILFECLVVARIVASRGVALALGVYDLRGVGWAQTHYIEPLARGFTPIAFVMLKTVDKGCGIGYAGPIADLRFGAQGDVTSISLGKPQRFIYQVRAGEPASGLTAVAKVLRRPRSLTELEFQERKWVGGVVHLSANDIYNLVVHSLSPAQVRAFNARVDS
ncbi:MAG TPA: hypothetical protein VGG92_04085 [Caulobacteraceae bacterium]|jgi:hypothetical protein